MAALSLLRPAALLLLPLLAGCAGSAPPAERPAAEPVAARPVLPPAASVLAGLRSELGPACFATGAAIHLGHGRFVTAAHLLDGSQGMLRRCPGLDSSLGKPAQLSFQGREQRARLIRLGRADLRFGLGTYYVGGRDLALLQLDTPPPGAAGLSLCAQGPRPGERVLVLTPYREQLAEISGLMREANPLHGGYAEMTLRLEAGESGGAVLDAAAGCLLGLVSHRQEGPPGERTRIVPAPVLEAFLLGQ
ncbi:trypsin-like peptidase domain-containing protein [Roseomonas sp. USHLN139]|uniref:trypsin-like peptidase domain-containing protein n=1 Tax=Roseomonas sp. USHLN139 TaxID=3081298 RepID=UPI003B028AC6